MAAMLQCIACPFPVYHKEFIEEYGPHFTQIAIKRLKETPDKSLRDVRREKIEGIIKAIDNLQKRYIGKDEREKETEVLKLEISLMCLKSNYLERRI